jgi:hypothetical protein
MTLGAAGNADTKDELVTGAGFGQACRRACREA